MVHWECDHFAKSTLGSIHTKDYYGKFLFNNGIVPLLATSLRWPFAMVQ